MWLKKGLRKFWSVSGFKDIFLIRWYKIGTVVFVVDDVHVEYNACTILFKYHQLSSCPRGPYFLPDGMQTDIDLDGTVFVCWMFWNKVRSQKFIIAIKVWNEVPQRFLGSRRWQNARYYLAASILFVDNWDSDCMKYGDFVLRPSCNSTTGTLNNTMFCQNFCQESNWSYWNSIYWFVGLFRLKWPTYPAVLQWQGENLVFVGAFSGSFSQ